MNAETIERIARVCHEANKAYCESMGDFSQVSWTRTDPALRASTIRAVEHALANPSQTPEESHAAWKADREATGWRYGPVKDVERKLHPCMVPYDELPYVQRVKDDLFNCIVQAIAPVQELETSGPDAEVEKSLDPKPSEDVVNKALKKFIEAMGYKYKKAKLNDHATLAIVTLAQSEPGEAMLAVGADLLNALGYETDVADEDLPEAVASFMAMLKQ